VQSHQRLSATKVLCLLALLRRIFASCCSVKGAGFESTALYRRSVLEDYTEARRYFELALTTNERELGDDSPFESIGLNNLAGLLQGQGNSAQVRPYYERAVQFFKKAAPSAPILRHLPPISVTFKYLKASMLRRGPASNAPWRSSRRCWTQMIHASRLCCNNSMFCYRYRVNKPRRRHICSAQSRFSLRRAIAIFEEAIGLDHPYVAASLGGSAMDLGDLRRAHSRLERALAIRQKALGPNHSDTAMSLNDFGILLQREGDYAGARSYLELALGIVDGKLGRDHPTTRQLATNAARGLDWLKLPEEAEELRRKFG
jgi:tetratricopeptide (TPR) repeat protein